MTEEEYSKYLEDNNTPFVYVGCSEIPRKVVDVVRSHYEKKGISVNEEAIEEEESREKYDLMYLKPDGTYAHADWRKSMREQGVDPDEVEKSLLKHFDEHDEKLKATDPAAYKKYREEMDCWVSEVQKLKEARQERYREVHQISEKERLERSSLTSEVSIIQHHSASPTKPFTHR